MKFALDDEHLALADAVASFLGRFDLPGVARGRLDDPALAPSPGENAWVESGFGFLTVPENAGGGGGTLLDQAVVAEQAGRVLAGPSLFTYARAAALLEADDQRTKELVSGELKVAVVDDPGAVPDAATAEAFLTMRGDDLVIAPGQVRSREPIDVTRGLAQVELGDGDVVLANAREKWDRALMIGRVILAAEGLGTAARAVEIAVAYAHERMAFGRAIGSYQAVKHALVDAHVQTEQLRSLVWWAAWAAENSPEEFPLASAAVKAAAAVTAQQAGDTLIQVHGGIGFTWEHDAHLYWRRARVDRLLLGDETEAFDQVARLAFAGAPVAGVSR